MKGYGTGIISLELKVNFRRIMMLICLQINYAHNIP